MFGLFDITMYCLGYNIFEAKKDLKRINKYNNEELTEWKNKVKWRIAKFHYLKITTIKKVGPTFPDKWQDLQ